MLHKALWWKCSESFGQSEGDVMAPYSWYIAYRHHDRVDVASVSAEPMINRAARVVRIRRAQGVVLHECAESFSRIVLLPVRMYSYSGVVVVVVCDVGTLEAVVQVSANAVSYTHLTLPTILLV
eukprot:6098977-Pyramimonas_sp.AAC.1